MGAEGVSTLVWILIWVGLFFVMMRYGCGAHMRGGHRHHGGEGGRSGSPQVARASPSRVRAPTSGRGASPA